MNKDFSINVKKVRPAMIPQLKNVYKDLQVCVCACAYIHTHFGPPTGQHKVRVNVLLSELLSHIEAERTVLVIDVAFSGISEDGVSVVYLLKLLCCFWVIRVFVRVKLQS